MTKNKDDLENFNIYGILSSKLHVCSLFLLTGDARPRFFESWTLCSRSTCGAREAMTVGCKPTMFLFSQI